MRDTLGEASDSELKFDVTTLAYNQTKKRCFSVEILDIGRRFYVAFGWCNMVKVDQDCDSDRAHKPIGGQHDAVALREAHKLHSAVDKV